MFQEHVYRKQSNKMMPPVPVATSVVEAISSTAKAVVERAKTPAEEYYEWVLDLIILRWTPI